MSKLRVFICAAVFILLGAVFAAADTVTLKNGDRITGKVKTLAAGKLTIETDYMGSVTFDSAKVASIATDEPVGVRSITGTRLVGKLAYQDGANAVVDTASGPLAIPASDVIAVGPVIEPGPAWHGSAEAGIIGQSGNRDTFNGNFAVNANRENNGLTLSGYALARYSTDNGVVGMNQQRAGGRLESAISEKYFWYSAIDLERDEFKDLALRTTAAVGLGRTWWKEGDDFWKTGVGVGFTNEAFTTGGSRTFPIAQLTSDYSKKIREGLIFTDKTSLVPSLSDLDGWRAENDAALSLALNKAGDWRLKLGMDNQYDNKPQPGVKRMDTFYYLNLAKTF